MKDRVEIDHLTKYDALRMNRDQVMDLNGSKIYTKIWLKNLYMAQNLYKRL